MNDDTAIIDDILVNNGPRNHQRYGLNLTNTYMPMSQTIPIASSEERILARTSHEWSTVSPIDDAWIHVQFPHETGPCLLGNDQDTRNP